MKLRGRLPAEEYEQLQREVLRRDGWRCQYCGSGENLQVHHQLSRARGGSDTADNLITLCAHCHRRIHLGTAAGWV